MEYFKKCVTVDFKNFDGRSRRKEYWHFLLVNFVISLVIGFVGGLISNEVSAGLSGLYALAILVPSLAVCIRRLHDLGKSGWWILGCLVPFLNIYVAILVAFIEGERETNQYGPNPKAGE